MNDPRLSKALAALDDARTYLVDVVDGNPKAPMRDLNHIDAARQLINASILHVQVAQKENNHV